MFSTTTENEKDTSQKIIQKVLLGLIKFYSKQLSSDEPLSYVVDATHFQPGNKNALILFKCSLHDDPILEKHAIPIRFFSGNVDLAGDVQPEYYIWATDCYEASSVVAKEYYCRVHKVEPVFFYALADEKNVEEIKNSKNTSKDEALKCIQGKEIIHMSQCKYITDSEKAKYSELDVLRLDTPAPYQIETIHGISP